MVKAMKAMTAMDVVNEAAGDFHAVIATFDRPDKFGDILRQGAFRQSIAAWRASGRKVPVVFAHQSNDPTMHVGEVDPADLRETPVGLHAEGTFYLQEPAARKVFTQLQRKALAEWSFAYRIERSKPLPTGGRELLQVALLELGPCLAGVGETQTLQVKSLTREMPPALAPYYARLDRALKRLAVDVAAH